MIPRFSIVVPYRRDEAAFETTLVSVLENRPDACEVIVAHDGSYSDPFDLGDEVRFVTARRGASLVELVTAAADAARGATVHVLADGLRASAGWADCALQQFESDAVGTVAPVIRQLGRPERIVAAGWTTDRGNVRRPLASGRQRPTTEDACHVFGAYLAASFWRTELLRACLSAAGGLKPDAAETVIAYAVAECGLQCRIAFECDVTGTEEALGRRSLAAGHRLHVARCACHAPGTAGAIAEAVWGLIRQPHRPQAWAFATGRFSAVLTGGRSIARIACGVKNVLGDYEEARLDRPAVLKMPAPAEFRRRAA